MTLNILTLWNQAVLDSWVITFSHFVKRLPYEMIERDCISFILSLSQTNQHVLSKYVSARMVGFIAEVALALMVAVLTSHTHRH